MQIKPDSRYCNSYATEANLMKKLATYGADLDKVRYIVVHTVQGRWTAVFVGQESLMMVHDGWQVVA